MSVWAWLAICAIAMLIGFIVLQRRNQAAADKVSAALDSTFKAGVQDVKDAIKK